MEIILIVLIAIACLSIPISIYLIITRALNRLIAPETIQNIVDSLLEYLTKTEEGQKNLLMIGGLIGNGVKTGVGIQRQSGKGGFNGLIYDLIGSILTPKSQVESKQKQIEHVM